MIEDAKQAVRAAMLDTFADSIAKIHAEAERARAQAGTQATPSPALSSLTDAASPEAAPAGPPDPGALGAIVFDLARLHYRTLDQIVTFCLQQAEPLFAPQGRGPLPAPLPEDDLSALLQRAQLLLLKYPVAAQAAFRAFVAEGRRFGATAEGQRWRTELAGSELIRRGRVVWEVGTLNILEEHAETAIPSKVVDAIVRATAVRALEPLLARLFERGAAREA